MFRRGRPLLWLPLLQQEPSCTLLLVEVRGSERP
jgi:hypothetical protein